MAEGLLNGFELSELLGDRRICFGQPLPSGPDFFIYRLLTGLTEVMHSMAYAINACFWLRRDLLQWSL
jgi:hypothetical protein